MPRFEEIKNIALEELQSIDASLCYLLNSEELAAVAIANIYQMAHFLMPLTQHYRNTTDTPMHHSVTIITSDDMVSIIKDKTHAGRKFNAPLVDDARPLRENVIFIIGAVEMVLSMM